MPQRASPPVHYPVHASGVLLCLWWVLTVLGVMLMLAWWLAGVAWSYLLLGWTLWLLAAGAAYWGWRTMQPGVLRWTGRQWLLEQSGATQPLVAVTVVLDVQQVFLLRCERAPRGRAYVLLQKNWAPAHWLDLRRAVYSSAYLPR